MPSKPKNCSTCANSYGYSKEFRRCERVGNYCEIEVTSPTLCGGKKLPLYVEKVTLFDKLFKRN